MTMREEIRASLKHLVAQKIESTKALAEYKARTKSEGMDTLKRMWSIASMRYERSITRDQIRYHQLAYAYARGRQYIQQEPKVREGNAPNVPEICEVLRACLPDDEISTADVSEATVSLWLQEGAAAVAVAAE